LCFNNSRARDLLKWAFVNMYARGAVIDDVWGPHFLPPLLMRGYKNIHNAIMGQWYTLIALCKLNGECGLSKIGFVILSHGVNVNLGCLFQGMVIGCN
jgi:hypothetical protein